MILHRNLHTKTDSGISLCELHGPSQHAKHSAMLSSSLEAAHLTETEEDLPFSTLLEDYRKELKALRDTGEWKASPERVPCEGHRNVNLCVETKCNGPVTLNPETSLRSMLRSMKDLDLDTLKEVTRLLRPKYTSKRILFLTAASSNHYKESEDLIHNLQDYVFPLLTNYSFVYYDLGLEIEQRSQLEQYCRCEVRTFPMSAMPDRLKNLKCYTWKPLIIHANLPTADTVIWTDASVRFRNRTILELLQHLDKTRLAVCPGGAAIAYHTHKTMFQYFQEETCSFSHVPELSAGFAGYKNDRFIREAVVKPWAACALSPHCMCLKSSLKCRDKIWRQYNHCHRFDQSALGIILSKLFRGHEVSVKMPRSIGYLYRGSTANYFDNLKSQSNISLFKHFT